MVLSSLSHHLVLYVGAGGTFTYFTRKTEVPIHNSYSEVWITYRSASGCTKGANRYDVRKIFWLFYPPPPCPHSDLLCSIKFTQPPFFIRCSMTLLQWGHHIWKLPKGKTTRLPKYYRFCSARRRRHHAKSQRAKKFPELSIGHRGLESGQIPKFEYLIFGFFQIFDQFTLFFNFLFSFFFLWGGPTESDKQEPVEPPKVRLSYKYHDTI